VIADYYEGDPLCFESARQRKGCYIRGLQTVGAGLISIGSGGIVGGIVGGISLWRGLRRLRLCYLLPYCV
jgi:hypothetical protein